MKLRHLFLAAIVAIGMMACNNEEVPQVVDGAESTVSVMVMPTSNGPVIRATGNLSGDGVLPVGLAAESEIKSLEVYLFHGQTPDGYKKATGTNVTQVLGVETHTGNKTMIVVANANLGAQPSLAALVALTKDLPSNITTGLPMTSQSVNINLVAGDNQYGFSSGVTNYDANKNQLSATPLPLVRVNARVAIVSAVLDLPAPTPGVEQFFDGLSGVEVAIFNVPKATKLFGAPLVTTSPEYLFGGNGGSPVVNWPSTLNSYQVGTYEQSFKDESVVFPISNTTANPAVYYYVNENNHTRIDHQTFIVLRAKPTKGGTAVIAEDLYTDSQGYTYYPIWVNNKDKGYTYGGSHVADNTIVRNNQYNISLIIKGIGNPTIDEVEKAFLDVNVKVEPWTVVTQNVTWN